MKKYIHTTLKGTLTAIMLMVGVSVWAEGNVAKIGETEYATLQAAINAAENGATISLIKDIDETVANTDNANRFTIDLGEHTWTYTQTENDFAALKQDKEGSVITLKNGSMVVSGTEGFNVWARNGKVIIESGNYTINSKEDYNIYTTSGYVEIYGGTFTNSNTEPYNHNASLKSLNLNVHNSLSTVEHIKVFGGTFTADPSKGDDSAWGTSTFVASGYIVKTHETTPQTTYTVEPKVKVVVSSGITEDSKVSAANALAGNTSVSETTGLGDNGSLAVSITDVTLDTDNTTVTSATFNVTPKDANGNTISTFSGTYTFRLPISAGIATDKWVNLKHNQTYIPASQVKADGDNKYVTVTTTSFSPFSYDVLENPVAKIGEQLYETVADAITAASAEETTIELIADVTDVTEESITIPAGKNINLVGGKHTVFGTITSSGTLTIASGTYTNTTEDALKTEGEGKISITGGIFTNEPEAGWIADGYEVMKGADNKFVVAATGIAEAQIGEVKYQTIALAIAAVSTEVEAEATTIIVLKDITNDFTIEEGQKIALSVASHTISGNISNAGTLSIADGTFTRTIRNSGTLNISGGTFEGTVTNSGTQLYITGGTFYSKPSSYTCEAGHELVVNNKGHYVVVLTSETEAQIGSEKYLTIGKAIEVAGSTATSITLLKDPTSTPTIEIPAGATITLAISNGLSKPIANSGALTIENGSTTGNLTIMTATATIIIKDGVTHKGVQLDGSLGDYVLKTIDGISMKTYRAEKRFTIQVGNGITDSGQRTAANALAGNNQLPIGLKESLGDNQSIAVTILSVTLDANNNVTSAKFNVELSGANGTAITEASNDITFRLPVSTGIDAGKWVNISNATEAIQGATVQAGKYIEITTNNFSNNSPNFSYTILATEPVAQIGKTMYVSVATAIEAATSAQTIEIIKDIDEVITVDGDKTITLAGGKYTLEGAIKNSSALTLASGTFNGAITSNGGTITINGGSFSSSLTTNGGAIAIKGGTFAKSCTFTETTDGIAISGGTFDNIPAVGVCAIGYVPVKNGEGKFNMTNDWKMTDKTAIGSINYYGSLNYTVATATYTRSVGMVGVGGNPAGTKYGTIYLPFSITAKPEGVVNLYKATGISESTLTITEVSSYPVAAGTPLIFELSAVNKEMKIVSSNATINVNDPSTTPAGDIKLVGTYTEQNYTEGLTSKYYLNGDKFHQAVKSLKVPAYRAYIEHTTSGARPTMLSIVKEGDETTSISAVEAFDGVTAVYDLNGRKQSGLQRGINIMRRADGSTVKVIVK